MPGYQTGAEMLTGTAQAATFDNAGPESNPTGLGALAGSLEDEEAQMRPLDERS